MAYFDQEFIRFFKGLSRNNTREWFHARKKTYEEHVKEPFADFVEEMIHRVSAIDPDVQIEPRDAIFRIARDIRFSKDKTPYKTFASAAVAPGGRKRTAPGLYFRFGASGVGIAGGVYNPDKEELIKIRRALVRDGSTFSRLLKAKRFRDTYGDLLGEKNKRLPREFADAAERYPFIANKQFYFYAEYEDAKIVLRRDLAAFVERHYRAALTVTQFLKAALAVTRSADASPDGERWTVPGIPGARLFQFHDHGGVVGGSQPVFLLAIFPVDLGVPDAGHHARGREQKVDPQTPSLMKRPAAVIPPRKRPGLGVLLPEGVPEPPREQGCEARALVGCVEDRPGEKPLVPVVERGGTDVEVTAQHERLRGLVSVPKMTDEGVEPLELAGVVLVPEVLAVGNVDGGHGKTPHLGRQQSRTESSVTGKTDLGDGRGFARDDCHTVPTLLAMDDRTVTGGLDLGKGELLRGSLDLLDPHDVGLSRLEPVKKELEPGPQRIDIPGRKPHELSSEKGSVIIRCARWS